MTTENQSRTEGGGETAFEADEDDLQVFASTFAHDLRTPLLVAQGHLAMLDADPQRTAGIENALENIERVLDEMVEMAENGGKIRPAVKVPLGVAAHNAWRQVHTGGAHLRVQSNRPIEADPAALDRILVNLLQNAVDHGLPEDVHPQSPDYGSSPGYSAASAVEAARNARRDGFVITVGALEDGFYVEDNGEGVSSELGDAVFESGVSTDGSGLGLHIVDRFASAHGWDVDVSTSSDGGARFSIHGVPPERDQRTEGRSP